MPDRKLAIVPEPRRRRKRVDSELEELRAELLRRSLEHQGADDEVKRLKQQLRAAEDLADWARLNHHTAALAVRMAMERAR